MKRAFTKTIACPCPEGQHTVDLSKPEWRMLDRKIRDLGEQVRVKISGRSYIAHRMYIAKHGIKGQELPELAKKGVIHES